MRGRLLETIPKAEQGAVPAAVARNHALGRPGTPPGGHYDPPARSSLVRIGALPVRDARPGSRNPQVERREAGASIARRALCLAGTVLISRLPALRSPSLC